MGTPPWMRLAAYLEQGREYAVFVGVRTLARPAWARVEAVRGDALVLPGRKYVPLRAVRSFLVAHPSGAVLDCADVHHPLPPGVHFLALARPPAQSQGPDVLHVHPAELERGRSPVDVVHAAEAPPIGQPRAALRHSTALRNDAAAPVRVTRFGAYRRSGGSYALCTVTGRPFTAGDFAEWYLADGGRIAPGATVTDPNSYSTAGVWWLHHFVLADGPDEHVTGAQAAVPPAGSRRASGASARRGLRGPRWRRRSADGPGRPSSIRRWTTPQRRSTRSACGPRSLRRTAYRTRSPSCSGSDPTTTDTWTKRSSPPASGVMNPKPRSAS
jgi:hypothetical protein